MRLGEVPVGARLRIFTQLDYRGDFYQWCAICSINTRIDLNTWDVNTGGTALNPNVSIADVLALSIDEAAAFLKEKGVERIDAERCRELARRSRAV